MPPARMSYRPIFMGIVGDSGAGKTTIAEGVAEIIGPDRVAFVSIDDYHRNSRVERVEKGLTASDPENNWLNIAEQHLDLLRSGEPILKPTYDHTHGELGPPEYVEPKPYIIVDGMLGFATRRLRKAYDVRVFLEPSDEVRAEWKMDRDTARRGYTVDQVRETMHAASVAAARFVQPQRSHADIVVRFQPPVDENGESLGDGSAGAGLNVRYILRPTLPHPDLGPLLQIDHGPTLELARDEDGKPVDILEIPGSIDDETAKHLEKLLWALVPETQTASPGVRIGRFRTSNSPAISHPLALTQLLLAYHLERAAIDQMTGR